MRYRITLTIDSKNGNPDKWDWAELIDEDILSLEVNKLEESQL